MTRASGESPTSCQTTSAETMNDPSIATDARPPDTAFGSRFPRNAFRMKPRNGNSGISDSTVCSPLQRGEGVRVQRLAVAEQGHDDGQADCRFRGGDGPPERDGELAIH